MRSTGRGSTTARFRSLATRQRAADRLSKRGPTGWWRAAVTERSARSPRSPSSPIVPLGVVPLGTLNHFARDIGISDKPEQAVEVLVADSRRRIDVGVANDIVFLNNAGVGSYPLIVHRREQMERRLGKWLAMVAAIRAVFPHRPETIHLKVDGELIDMRATVVFFGNNDYVVEEGRFTRSRSMPALVRRSSCGRSGRGMRFDSAFASPADRVRSERDLDHRLGTSITLEVVGRNELLLSHDGEVTSVTTPLQVCVRERALEVIAPPER